MRITRIRADTRLGRVLITAAWGTMTATILLAAIFRGNFIPGYRTFPNLFEITVAYVLVLLVGVLSGMILKDLGAAVVSSFAAWALAAVVEYLVLTLPSTLGLAGSDLLRDIGLTGLSDLAATIVFPSIFPVPLFLGIIGSVAGAVLADRFLD